MASHSQKEANSKGPSNKPRLMGIASHLPSRWCTYLTIQSQRHYSFKEEILENDAIPLKEYDFVAGFPQLQVERNPKENRGFFVFPLRGPRKRRDKNQGFLWETFSFQGDAFCCDFFQVKGKGNKHNNKRYTPETNMETQIDGPWKR